MLLLLLLASTLALDLCPRPYVLHGEVTGTKADNFFRGQVTTLPPGPTWFPHLPTPPPGTPTCPRCRAPPGTR